MPYIALHCIVLPGGAIFPSHCLPPPSQYSTIAPPSSTFGVRKFLCCITPTTTIIIIIIIITGVAPFTYDPFTYHPFYLPEVGKRVAHHHHHYRHLAFILSNTIFTAQKESTLPCSTFPSVWRKQHKKTH